MDRRTLLKALTLTGAAALLPKPDISTEIEYFDDIPRDTVEVVVTTTMSRELYDQIEDRDTAGRELAEALMNILIDAAYGS